MEPNMEIFSPEQMASAIDSGQFPYMVQAVLVATTLCKAWRADDETGEPYSVMELAEYARECDSEGPLPDGMYYMVTREGAIGLCPGQEWLTEWLFVPMEPCPVRDVMERQLDQQVEALLAQYPSLKSSADLA